MKKRTPEEVETLARSLEADAHEGSILSVSKKHGVSGVYAGKLIKDVRSGRFNQTETDLNEISELVTNECTEIIETAKNSLPMPYKTEIIKILVYRSGDTSNGLVISVENPIEIKDRQEYDLEIQRRVVQKLQWIRLGREFEEGRDSK